MAGHIAFSTTAFLEEHFSTPDGVVGLLAKHTDLSPQRPAVVKWFTRGSVPGEWWPTLLYVIEQENGEPLSMRPYFEICGGAGDEANNDIFG